MSNLSLQQKVTNYLHKNKPKKNKQETEEAKQPLQDFNEIKGSIPEDVRNMVESYRQQHPMFSVTEVLSLHYFIRKYQIKEQELYSILKRFDYNKKVADDHINVLKERAKGINSGDWIQVSQKPKQKVAKGGGEKSKDAEKKEGKKKNYQPKRDRDDFYGKKDLILIDFFEIYQILDMTDPIGRNTRPMRSTSQRMTTTTGKTRIRLVVLGNILATSAKTTMKIMNMRLCTFQRAQSCNMKRSMCRKSQLRNRVRSIRSRPRKAGRQKLQSRKNASTSQIKAKNMIRTSRRIRHISNMNQSPRKPSSPRSQLPGLEEEEATMTTKEDASFTRNSRLNTCQNLPFPQNRKRRSPRSQINPSMKVLKRVLPRFMKLLATPQKKSRINRKLPPTSLLKAFKRK